MALPSLVWYVRDTGTLGYSAVTAWTANTAKAAGALVRATAPAVGSERVFIATTGGTTQPTQPTWPITQGGNTSDGTVVWFECTGQAGVNHDLTNCPNWTAAKGNAIATGYVIQNNAGTFLFICTTAGTAGSGSEPTWNTTAGVTTADNTVTWTSIGAVGNFGNWAAPHARVAMALNWTANGDTVYVGSDHAETQATALAWTAGTLTAPTSVICIGTSTLPPTSATTGASISTTGASTITMASGASVLYLYGLAVHCGASGSSNVNLTTNAAPSTIMAESCTFDLATTSASARINFGICVAGTATSAFVMRNCAFTFGNVSQSIQFTFGNIELINCTFAATGSVPTTLFRFAASSDAGEHVVRDSDLSAISGTLVAYNTSASTLLLANCKINASVTLSSGTIIGLGGCSLRMHNCDSTSTNYRITDVTYGGTMQQSTSTFRSGGASDGVTPLSWQIVSTSMCRLLIPFRSEDIAMRYDTTGVAKTATIYLTCASTLTNGDVWVELEYLGSALAPQGTNTSTRAAILGSTTALTTDVTSTWTGGLGNNYQIAVPFTPNMAGAIKAQLYVGKPSLTLNFDPLIVVT